MRKVTKILARGLIASAIVGAVCEGGYQYYKHQAYSEGLRCISMAVQARNPELPTDTCARPLRRLSPDTPTAASRYKVPTGFAGTPTRADLLLNVGPEIYFSVEDIRADQRAQLDWAAAGAWGTGIIALAALLPLAWCFLLDRIRELGNAWRGNT